MNNMNNHQLTGGNLWSARAAGARKTSRYTTRPPPGLGFENTPQALLFYGKKVLKWDLQSQEWVLADPEPKPKPAPAPTSDTLPRLHPSQCHLYRRAAEMCASYETHGSGYEPDAVEELDMPMDLWPSHPLIDNELGQPRAEHQRTEEERIAAHAMRRTRDVVQALHMDASFADFDASSDSGFYSADDAAGATAPRPFAPGKAEPELAPRDHVELAQSHGFDEGLRRGYREHLQATAEAQRRQEAEEKEDGEGEEDGWEEVMRLWREHLRSPVAEEEEEADETGEGAEEARRAEESRPGVQSSSPLLSWGQSGWSSLSRLPSLTWGESAGSSSGSTRVGAQAAASQDGSLAEEAWEMLSQDELWDWGRYDPRGLGLLGDGGVWYRRTLDVRSDVEEEEEEEGGG